MYEDKGNSDASGLPSGVVCNRKADGRESGTAEGERLDVLATLVDAYEHKLFPLEKYHLVAGALGQGHRDWRYDEFRLDEKGRLIHEIE